MHSQAPSINLPGWLAVEERKALRISARLKAHIEGERVERRAVTITDVSNLGCKITSPETVRIGSFVTLTAPGFMGFNGWVAWSRDGEFGLDFAHELPTAVVNCLIETGHVGA